MFLKPQTPFPIPIKLKEGSNGPLGSCFRRLPPGEEIFSRFQKGRFKFRISKVSKSLPRRELIKKDIKWTTFGLLSQLLLGDQKLTRFQKDRSSHVFFKHQTPFPIPIKWKQGSIGPLGSCFRRLPPGDETFSWFQKGLFLTRVFETPNSFYYSEKRGQMNPLGAAFVNSVRGTRSLRDRAFKSFAGPRRERVRYGDDFLPDIKKP